MSDESKKHVKEIEAMFQSSLKDRQTIGFFTGVLQGLMWRVDDDSRRAIESALERAKTMYSA